VPETKKFKVIFTKIDLADPSDLLKNKEQLLEAAKTQTEQLNKVDENAMRTKMDLAKMIDQNNKLANEIGKVEAKARLWAKLTEEKNKRKSNEKMVSDKKL
jgi:GTPase involved in cell partitioning and DNA repair